MYWSEQSEILTTAELRAEWVDWAANQHPDSQSMIFLYGNMDEDPFMGQSAVSLVSQCDSRPPSCCPYQSARNVS